MRSFQQRIGDFEARGIRIAAISTDTPEDNRRQRDDLGVTFPLLSDPKAEAIKRYDLLHPGGAPGGADIARPAEFLIDPAGTVRWVNLTESSVVRARPDEVLDTFDALPR